MSLLNRCAKLLKQGAEAILAPAEDPRQSYPTHQNHPLNLLKQVRQALMENKAFRNQLQSRKVFLENHLLPLEQKARQALQEDREDLARLALQRRHAYLKEIEALNRQIQETQREEERQQLIKLQLETQIETLQSRQQVLNARYSAAEAQVRLSESLSSIAEAFIDLDLSLEEAEQQSDYMQARAAAVNDLMAAGVLEIPTFIEIDQGSQAFSGYDDAQAIESQLMALKREIQDSR